MTLIAGRTCMLTGAASRVEYETNEQPCPCLECRSFLADYLLSPAFVYEPPVEILRGARLLAMSTREERSRASDIAASKLKDVTDTFRTLTRQIAEWEAAAAGTTIRAMPREQLNHALLDAADGLEREAEHLRATYPDGILSEHMSRRTEALDLAAGVLRDLVR